jgi:hypothetical protein
MMNQKLKYQKLKYKILFKYQISTANLIAKEPEVKVHNIVEVPDINSKLKIKFFE